MDRIFVVIEGITMMVVEQCNTELQTKQNERYKQEHLQPICIQTSHRLHPLLNLPGKLKLIPLEQWALFTDKFLVIIAISYVHTLLSYFVYSIFFGCQY